MHSDPSAEPLLALDGEKRLLSVKAAVCSNAGGLRAGLVQGAEQRKEGRAQGWLWGAVVSTMRTRTPLGSLTCGWSVCR